MRTNASDEDSIVSKHHASQQQVWNVSHARGACDIIACDITYDGQRCALLTIKSRNTWTRATDFNSSG
jgi:hypothetical protein